MHKDGFAVRLEVCGRWIRSQDPLYWSTMWQLPSSTSPCIQWTTSPCQGGGHAGNLKELGRAAAAKAPAAATPAASAAALSSAAAAVQASARQEQVPAAAAVAPGRVSIRRAPQQARRRRRGWSIPCRVPAGLCSGAGLPAQHAELRHASACCSRRPARGRPAASQSTTVVREYSSFVPGIGVQLAACTSASDTQKPTCPARCAAETLSPQRLPAAAPSLDAGARARAATRGAVAAAGRARCRRLVQAAPATPQNAAAAAKESALAPARPAAAPAWQQGYSGRAASQPRQPRHCPTARAPPRLLLPPAGAAACCAGRTPTAAAAGWPRRGRAGGRRRCQSRGQLHRLRLLPPLRLPQAPVQRQPRQRRR